MLSAVAVFFVAAAILLINAEIPLITVKEQLTLGQCMNTSECLYYTEIYPLLTESDIYCNLQTTRCETTSGEVLSPTFNALCSQLSMTTVTYPAVGYGNLWDGMIQVTISAPTNFIHGVLRLFVISSFQTNANLSVPYIQEQFANAPVFQYTFRTVAPGSYAIQYFHESGCIDVVYPSDVVDALNGTYMPSAAVFDPITNFVFYDHNIVFTLEPFAFGVGTRAGFVSGFPLHYFHTQPADVGAGQRVPFAQIFDVSGGILRTVVSDKLRLTSGNDPTATTGGITYPLYAEGIVPVVVNQLQAMTLSGAIVIQFGFGFSFLSCANCTPYFIQDSNGMYEGWRMEPIYRNISDAQYMNATTGGYEVAPMHYTLNGIFTNTLYMYYVD